MPSKPMSAVLRLPRLKTNNALHILLKTPTDLTLLHQPLLLAHSTTMVPLHPLILMAEVGTILYPVAMTVEPTAANNNNNNTIIRQAVPLLITNLLFVPVVLAQQQLTHTSPYLNNFQTQ